MPSLTTDGSTASTGRPLVHRLVDDAAVFPPGNAPLADAVSRHAAHRDAWYSDCVGPLLVPAASVAELLGVLGAPDAVDSGPAAAPLDLVLIARPGADPATVPVALHALRDEPRLRVVGAELGWYQGWRDLGLDDLALALEVPRGPGHAVAVTDVDRAHRDGAGVVAKFRTGPTPTWPWPDEAELATFLGICAGSRTPFKLTGGLHHAARGTYAVAGVSEENHGVLNVLVATSAALARGGHDEVAALLAVRDATALAELVDAWPDDTAARVREEFTAFGCCTVTDPVGELADLGLLARP